jgi:hypothetical protein
LDIKSKLKLFCDQKAKLTENSINFDVQKLLSLGVDAKSATTLDSLSAVQIATMHLDCNLMVGGYITNDQFLAKQTEILQFGVDLESVRQVAEEKAAAGNNSGGKTASSAPGSATAGSSGASNPAAGASGTTAKTAPAAPASGSTPSTGNKSAGTTQKPAALDLDAIAQELGVTLKHYGAVSQSGNENLVQSGVEWLLENYSPIEVNK